MTICLRPWHALWLFEFYVMKACHRDSRLCNFSAGYPDHPWQRAVWKSRLTLHQPMPPGDEKEDRCARKLPDCHIRDMWSFLGIFLCSHMAVAWFPVPQTTPVRRIKPHGGAFLCHTQKLMMPVLLMNEHWRMQKVASCPRVFPKSWDRANGLYPRYLFC